MAFGPAPVRTGGSSVNLWTSRTSCCGSDSVRCSATKVVERPTTTSCRFAHWPHNAYNAPRRRRRAKLGVASPHGPQYQERKRSGKRCESCPFGVTWTTHTEDALRNVLSTLRETFGPPLGVRLRRPGQGSASRWDKLPLNSRTSRSSRRIIAANFRRYCRSNRRGLPPVGRPIIEWN